MKIFIESVKTKKEGFWHAAESLFERRLPAVYAIFLKIAEPRLIRVMQFGVYICMIFAGSGVLISPPIIFQNIVGLYMVYVLGAFLTLGAILGAIAVLPGIWWLERAGLIGMATGIMMYAVIVVAMGSSGIGIAVCIAFVFTFGQRWLEIQGAQLAPKDPREIRRSQLVPKEG